MIIKSITVYCSSSDKLKNTYYQDAEEISKLIASLKINIVYGGAKVGIMGVVAKTAKENKNKVTGVITNFLSEKEIIFKNIDELKIVDSMSERKKLLFELGDAYLALPGGTGTLEEIIEVVSWKVMGIHNKPIIFFNKNNFWDNLFKQFKFFEDEKFSNKNLQNTFHIIDTVKELKNILIKWQR
ncbi:TIGR00730 family Rossman fold protein [Pelagibacteraceae bacterium]|nr:TIGR00730 family Rossman fold protein [Pelagibacteraceae bacterium]